MFAHLGPTMHVFQTDKIIQAQVGVSRVAAPVLGPEAVHGGRLVALRLEVAGQGEHGLGDVLLIGLGAAGQEGRRIAGQSLELHITGATAKAGAVGPAIGAGLLQVVHHINNGRLFYLLVLGGGGRVAGGVQRAGGELLALIHIVQNGIHRLF